MRKSSFFLALTALGLLASCTSEPTYSFISADSSESTTSSEETSITQPEEETLVNTVYGTLEGKKVGSSYQFLGVPYAHFEGRFKPASEMLSWTGTMEATSEGSISYQGTSSFRTGQADDCLNLNIYTPSTKDGKKRPVMVWLHGGGFSSGSANGYDGQDLAEKNDVVVVGVNHRLNLFGFLDLCAYGDEYKYSANVGIEDIELALRYVQKNIGYFGGDKDNVTLFGQSGGGAKVLALMTAPSAKGLFKRGIVESGATETVGVVFNSQEQSTRLTQNLLSELNLTSSAEDIASLTTMDVSTLESAANRALSTTAEEFQIPAPFGSSYQMEFQPVVDGDYMPTNAITEDGFAESGKGVDLLIGSNLNEWTTWYPNSVSETEELTSALEEAYPNEDVDLNHVDTLIRLPMLKIMSHKADQNDGKVYSYVFTKGSSYHGAEINYVFHHNSGGLGDTLPEAFVNFASTGTPSASGLETWEPYTRESGACMILDDTSYLAHNHDKKLLSLLEPDYVY